MLDERINIFEYEEILMGQKQSFTCSFNGTEKDNQIEVGNVWRYAITELLGWTPKEAVNNLTMDIVKMLCLDRTFRAINFNPSFEYKGDFKFVLRYAFPEDIHYSLRDEAISEYNHVAHINKWSGVSDEYRYPKNFFIGEDGILRAKYLLNYVIGLYLSDYSVEKLYDFFADEKKAKRWINSKKLSVPLHLTYLDPLDYFHESLSYANQNEFYYYNHRIKQFYEKNN